MTKKKKPDKKKSASVKQNKKKKVVKKPIKKKQTTKKVPVKKKPQDKKTVKKRQRTQREIPKEELKVFSKTTLEKKLTTVEKSFCKRLVYRMGNASLAYQDVFPAAKARTATAMSSKWLADINIKAYYSIVKQEAEARNKVDVDYILTKHRQIIEADVLDLYKDGTNYFTLKKIKDFPKNLRWLIQSVKPTQAGIQLKLLDKQKALAALGNISGIDKQDVNISSQAVGISFDGAGENF